MRNNNTATSAVIISALSALVAIMTTIWFFNEQGELKFGLIAVSGIVTIVTLGMFLIWRRGEKIKT